MTAAASLGPGSMALQARAPASRRAPARSAGRVARVVVVRCAVHGREPTRPRALACAEPATAAGLAAEGLVPPSKLQLGQRRSSLRVAVDVDEVLGRFVFALNQFCKEEYGMDYDVSDYWIYEFAKIWDCTQDHSNHVVHEFFKSPHFNDGIPIVGGAYESLARLKSHCDLVVVTSRQHVIQDVTLEWLDRHYDGLFSDVYFGNHFAKSGASRKKSDICRSIGAHVLIDDNPGYALDCATNGIDVLLYDWHGSYPWSKMPPGDQHERIRVVHNWEQVEAAVMAMAAAR